MTLRAGTARVFARKVHVCHGICTQSEILVTAGQDCLHICPASFLSKRMKTYCKRAAQDCLHICLAKLVSKTQANLLQKSGARLSAQMSCTACCWKKETVIAKEWRKTVCTYVLRSLLQKQGKLNISSADFSLLLAGLCGEQSSKSSSADLHGQASSFQSHGLAQRAKKSVKKNEDKNQKYKNNDKNKNK